MAFEGWKGDFVGFFTGLELDNSKRYFEAHRKQYEQDVKGPLEELVRELDPDVGGTVKMFRLNRDIRFSPDKRPYKTNVAAVIGELYVHLDARRLFIGTGSHAPDNTWLKRYRDAVASPAGGEFQRIVEQARKDGCTVGGNRLKTAPKGYEPDHPRIELLRWREVVAGKTFPIERWIATPKAKDRILEAWRQIKPFSDWLVENVGST